MSAERSRYSESAETMKQGFVVAIDGPVASGKGTLAKDLAHHFGGVCLDSGSMYRALGLYLLEKGLDPSLEDDVKTHLGEASITLNATDVFLNGTSVTDKIRTPEVSQAASQVGVFAPVQEKLIETRRKIAQELASAGKIVVSEGRNEGTATFPDAAVKIYLDAKVETRAARRLAQLQEKGIDVSFDDVLRETRERDQRDTNREVAPLVKNPKEHGYILIDNTGQNEEETLQDLVTIIEEVQQRND